MWMPCKQCLPLHERAARMPEQVDRRIDYIYGWIDKLRKGVTFTINGKRLSLGATMTVQPSAYRQMGKFAL
jgi:hypothetical protein